MLILNQIKEREMTEAASKQELQERTFTIATTWHEGMGLEAYGVNLGACLDFQVLATVNEFVARQLAGVDDDGTD